MPTKKKQLNIIDIIIIVALVLIVLAVVGKAVTEYTMLPQNKTVRYVLKTEAMDSLFSDNLKAGEKIFSVDGETCLGEVVSVSPSAVYHTGKDKDGNDVQTEIEDQTVLYVTVDTKSNFEGGSFYVGETVISIGDEFEIRCQDLWFKSECVSLQILNSEQD